MKVRVFFHGKCFDGTASAALFSRFYRERIRPDADFQFTGLVHRAGALFDETDFDGDENAIVDFKYSASPRITWWFDHHQSAFLTPQDAEHYRLGDKSHKFYDPDFKSCTKFLAHVAQEKFGFNPAPVAELVHWADVIDGAQFASPQQAVEMAEPAMKLTMAIESTNDAEFLPRLIPFLVSEPLAQVLQEPFVAAVVPPLLERHWRSIDILRERSECRQGTIFFDITDYDLEGYNKFIPYYLHPGSVYSVGLSSSSFRVKVSVGSNPWTDQQNMVNLAKICERYGGGGHARVGAISFPPNQAEAARAAAKEIVQELRAAEST
ncbi:MAG TPA: hypothetical protein VLT16_15580 [Candidatus Limnocylindrales bacterium]|nr:hypothetical protein [Candidatus Limnocylindrales bacterium]